LNIHQREQKQSQNYTEVIWVLSGLYRDGKLIGAVGVSGDGVEQDETVALAAAKGYAA